MLQSEFFNFRTEKIRRIRSKYEQYKKNPNKRLAKDYAAKYPFLKRKSEIPSLKEMLKWKSTNKRFNVDTQIKPLLESYIAKITGIYKHGQTMKTLLCNLRIVSNVELGKFTIAISKNTLSAKEQWESRLIKDLKEKFPRIPLKELILIISSKPNTLGGNATHCKNVQEAWMRITQGNFKVVFVCSNKQRIQNLQTMLACYSELRSEKQFPIDIIMDEAHNLEEGIPSKRDFMDTILMSPFVQSFVPVSASPEPIFSNDEPLWNKNNLERNAINYTPICDVMSNSPNYSSIAKANQLSFETLKAHPRYTHYNMTEFGEDTFEEALPPGEYANSKMTPEEIQEDKIRRRQLEFCSFMAFEKSAMNYGMNLLDNFFIYEYKLGEIHMSETIILPNEFNLHLITTPLRVAFTIELMKYALTKEYNPICIGLYRSGIHLRYKNKAQKIVNKKVCDFDEDNSTSQEMNEKIHKIIEKLKAKDESVQRPIIIFGNYKPTGESITFVNFKYGTLRSNTLLPRAGQTRELDYQAALRGCYMDTKFKEVNPDFVQPVKFLIGSNNSIQNALAYEKENDQRVLSLSNGTHPVLFTAAPLPDYSKEEDSGGISVPCKINIHDHEAKYYQSIRELLKKKSRTEEDKLNILNYLSRLIENNDADIHDCHKKVDFKTFRLIDVRTYKAHTEDEIAKRKEKQGDKYKPFEADWRFQEYESAYTNRLPYINNKNKMEVKDCELLVAYDVYKLGDFKNHKTVMWLSYRYA